MSTSMDSGLQHLRTMLPPQQALKVRSVNELHNESLTVGQKVADAVARNMGSWRFIITQSCLLALWIVLNTIELVFRPFDPYPFILLNLTLSFQAAYAAPIIMMSQNRQADKDRLAAEHDYCTNIRADTRIQAVLDHLQAQDDVILTILRQLEQAHSIQPDAAQRTAETRLHQFHELEAQWIEKTVWEEEGRAGLLES